MIKYFKELENPSNYYLELPNLNANGPLGDIDIKTLNDAIADLQRIIQPLAKLFGR